MYVHTLEKFYNNTPKLSKNTFMTKATKMRHT